MNELEQQATQFASDLTATVQSVVGPDCPAFTALAVPATAETPAHWINMHALYDADMARMALGDALSHIEKVA